MRQELALLGTIPREHSMASHLMLLSRPLSYKGGQSPGAALGGRGSPHSPWTRIGAVIEAAALPGIGNVNKFHRDCFLPHFGPALTAEHLLRTSLLNPCSESVLARAVLTRVLAHEVIWIHSRPWLGSLVLKLRSSAVTHHGILPR